ncbi:MAG: D-glycero-beta-D-manno-heptose-7-phosphate kinase [Pyrinomonadaceae bacterium]|nr:D-glycero-beta-D-manno-heptose-7-phosphate kinase [Pyrinomonadaceae bacterium]
MQDTLDKFSEVEVLVVGDAMLDQYWWGAVNRISPEAPVPVVSLERKTTIPGGTANVAANIAGLGAKAHLVGVVGDDEEGNELRKTLENIGVSSDHLIPALTRPTTSKTRIIANNQQVTRVDRESTDPLATDTAKKLLDKVAALINDVDIVLVSDYAKGVITAETAARIISLAAENGKQVLVDPKGKDYSKYRGASILTPNQKEALEACGFDEVDDKSIPAAGDKLMSDLGLEFLLITRGEKGMSLFSAGKGERQIAANARRVFDVTGAGDTVISTLAVALAAGNGFYDSCEMANIAAGLVVEKVGTRPISKEEMSEYYKG